MTEESDYKKKLGEAIRFILYCIVRNENGVHSPYEIPLFDKDMNKKNVIWNLDNKTYEDLTGIYHFLDATGNYNLNDK